MHIVVNALLVHGAFSGVQHAILHQLRALLATDAPHRYTVIAAQDAPMEELLGETRRPYHVVRAPVRGGQRAARLLWEQLALPRVLAAEDAELLYSPGYLTPLRWDGPAVVFIHDTIALSHPHLCTVSNAVNYRCLLPASARHATCVAVPSAVSAGDVTRYCGVPAERVHVVPLGVHVPPAPTPAAMAAARARMGIDAPYLLAVSTIEPKKNFAHLIRWFGTWKAAGIPHHLVIAGKWGWGCRQVHRALGHSRFRNYIHLPGYLPQEELPPLIAGADLLLMPSRYEGFGLPVLEAMAVGTPVVVSDQGALPETAGEAGLVVPLESVLWRAEIPTILHHPDRLEAVRAAGRARAADFTWERTAEKLLAVFEAAVAACDANLCWRPPTDSLV